MSCLRERSWHRLFCGIAAGAAFALFSTSGVYAAPAAEARAVTEYRMGPGDVLKVMVYQSPDLSLDVRLSEAGEANFPLIGRIRLGGLTVTESEKKISDELKSGGFIKNPQVFVTIAQVRANFVNVLGQLGKPGRYPLDIAGIRLTEIVALAGGLSADSSDQVVIVGTRGGTSKRMVVDFPALFQQDGMVTDPVIQPGDSIWVERAPVAFMYGEIGKPGALRITRNMTVLQALAASGGVTPRGTTRGIKMNRRDVNSGQVIALEPKMDDLLQDGDILFIKESLF